MKLYYMPGACSLASHIVLEWLGAPYEAMQVPKDELKTSYLAVNPAGTVPALVEDDGWLLTQNVAILAYLVDRGADSALAGGDTPRGRAEVTRWLGFLNSDLHPAFKPFFGATAYLEDDAVIARTKAHAGTRVLELLGRVDVALAGRAWLAGTRSIADPYLYVMLRWAEKLRLDLSGFANIATFRAHMDADAGVQRALAAEG